MVDCLPRGWWRAASVGVFLGSYQGETIGSWAARVVQPAAQALLELSDQPHKWLDRMRAVTDQ